MAHEWDLKQHEKKPDIICIGKALSGGVSPVSGILADEAVMNSFKLGDHGSTYGGNPLAMAVAETALQVVLDEDLVYNSLHVGTYMHQELYRLESPMIKEVRGLGLMNALEIRDDLNVNGHHFADILRNYHILSKVCQDYSVKFSPSLLITKEEVDSVI